MSNWLLSHLWLSLLTGSGVVLLALLLMTRTRDPVARHRILVCFLPVLGMLPLAQVAMSEFARPGSNLTGASRLATITEIARIKREAGRFLESEGAVVGPSNAANSGSNGVQLANWTSRIAPGASVVYLTGAGLLLLIVSLRGVQTVRLLRSCGAVSEPRVLALWRSLLHARRRDPAGTDLKQSDDAPTPGCWGVLRATVVLPSSEVTNADTERLSLVLRHELVHVARRDVAISLLQHLVRAMHWFNPLVWMYSTLLNRYRELSCDAIVVRQTGKHQSYALALLEYCRPRAGRSSYAGMLGLAMAGTGGGRGHRTEIRRRLTMILSEQEQRASMSRVSGRVTAAFVTLALAGSMTAAAILGPGPLPSESPMQPAAGAKTKEAPTRLLLKEPEARLRLVEGALQLQKPTREPCKTLLIELPDETRSVEPILKVQGVMDASGKLRIEGLGGTITEQETLVSGEDVTVRRNVLLAERLTLHMPEGSRLRTALEGESIDIAKQDDKVELKMNRGVLRLADEGGVSRVTLRLADIVEASAKTQEKPLAEADGRVSVEAAAPPDGTITIAVTEEQGEVVMRFKATRADGTPAQIRADLDLKTGVPAGEKDPPPGAVRYRLFNEGGEAGEPLRVKIQWVHDVAKLIAEKQKKASSNNNGEAAPAR